ncbi:hypothetical protein B0H13DRAFT_1911451 [Mycena leptocephala]|nr:hypothetical protein B0H13DRAFT_1911451 [Mycena leptocephala]
MPSSLLLVHPIPELKASTQVPVTLDWAALLESVPTDLFNNGVNRKAEEVKMEWLQALYPSEHKAHVFCMCGIVRGDVVHASPHLETLSPVGHPICSLMAFYAKPRNHVLLLWDAVYSSDAGDVELLADYAVSHTKDCGLNYGQDGGKSAHSHIMAQRPRVRHPKTKLDIKGKVGRQKTKSVKENKKSKSRCSVSEIAENFLGWMIPDHPSMASQDRRIPAAPLCSLDLYDQGQVVQVDWWMPPQIAVGLLWVMQTMVDTFQIELNHRNCCYLEVTVTLWVTQGHSDLIQGTGQACFWIERMPIRSDQQDELHKAHQTYQEAERKWGRESKMKRGPQAHDPQIFLDTSAEESRRDEEDEDRELEEDSFCQDKP